MSYDAEVFADAPLAYLKLNDTAGASGPADLGSLGTTWTYSAVAALGQPEVTTDGGTSVSNDNSVPDAIAIGEIASTVVDGFSIECWADLGATAMLAEFVIYAPNMSGTFTGAGVQLAVATSSFGVGRDLLVLGESGGTIAGSYPAVPPGPHHIVVTLDVLGVYTLYVDGAPVGSPYPSSTLTGPYDLFSNLVVGGYPGAALAPLPDCRFDNVALYGAALDSARVAAHYAAGSSAPTAILTARGATRVTMFNIATAAAAAGRTAVHVLPVVVPQVGTRVRAVAGLVLNMTTPAIIDGKPTVPAHWAQLSQSFTAIEGAAHIHAIKDPNPAWNPYTGGWYTPPPVASKPWRARWSVNDLPDPSHYSAGYYWLGDPSNADGTGSIQSGARQWNPDRSTPSAPAWHSAFPFKPSVTAANHYLQGGGIVHHPRGVNFNTHFIEHMWTSFPSSLRQPYTWVIAGMVASWPSANYQHAILDAGVNPATLGVHLSAEDCASPRRLREAGTPRNLLQVSAHQMVMSTHPSTGKIVRCRVNTHVRPCLFVGIFNGSQSSTGIYEPGSKRLQKGRVDPGTSTHYVLGRQNGWLDQRRASHLLLFELRYFTKALTRTDLDNQYDQLSATYQFNRYRSL